jgi:hypothetical protein
VDESLLPPPARPQRPVPWRPLAALFLPAAAVAAGTGLQRWLEGPVPSGDSILRWLFWSAGAGLLLGAAAGAMRRAPLRWAAYGAAGPWLLAALVFGGARASLPVRQWVADRREAGCRAEGRKLCTLREFDAACARRDQQLLGDPQQSLCKDATCTLRWTWRGPFRPEEIAFRGGFICSIVTDAQGNGVRSTEVAFADP